MNKLVCDMTNVCKSYLSEENIEYLHKITNASEDKRLKNLIDDVISTKFSYDSDHYYNIPFDNIQEGDILIADVSEFMKVGCIWEYIRIDHIYRNVIFYTVLNDNIKKKEGFCQVGSIFFSKGIYPCYIVKDKNYTITCDCPMVKIVDNANEITDNFRSYEYKIREKRDY